MQIIRGVDYAFCLLIHRYEGFVQAGLGFKKSKSDHLTEYAQSIIDRAGKSKMGWLVSYMHKRLFKDQDHLDVAYAMSDVGGSLSQLGRYDAALQNQKKVLPMRKCLFPEQDHPEIARTLNSIGELLSHLGDYEQALQYKQKDWICADVCLQSKIILTSVVPQPA